MENLIGMVQAVCIGKSQPFTRSGIYSAINKTAVRTEVEVHYEGLIGDEQADIRVHGGLDKAVHIYPFEHYAELQSMFRNQYGRFMSHGSFGENLSTLGLNEDNICVGDLLSIGSAVLEVTQTRQPCWKVNDKFGVPDLAEMMQQKRITGFYCRVLQPGKIASGHSIELSERRHPDWPLRRVLNLLYQNPLNKEELMGVLKLPLTPKWRAMFEHRLSTNSVEDWIARLIGPEKYEFSL